MIKFEVLNELTLKVTYDYQNEFIHSKQGAMIGMQGQNPSKPIEFEKEILGPAGANGAGGIGRQLVGSAVRRVTGENLKLMKAKANGSAIGYFAFNGNHVFVFHLQPGQMVSVESENLLAFTDDCKYGVSFMGMGVVSQGGLCKSTLTGVGPNAEVAILVDGNPLVMSGPCVCDPDAYICHMGKDPGFGMDLNWKMLIGQSSGESYNMKFTDPHNVVVVQPKERESGINIGMDGGSNGNRPETQNAPSFGQPNFNQGNYNQPQNNVPNMGSSVGNTVGNILGGLLG